MDLRSKKSFAHTILSVLVLGLVICFTNPAGAVTKVPHFALPAADDGKVIDINAYQGKVVLLNFFATWCPPCRKEIKSLIELQNEFGVKQLVVIGISMDDGSSRAKVVSKFIKKTGINYPVALGDEHVAKDFGGVIGIPQSFLVDQSGNVVKSYPGYVDHAVFKNDIESLLK